MLLAIGACGEAGDAVAAPDALGSLTVTCTEETTVVDVTSVEAEPAGVAVDLKDQTDHGLVVLMSDAAGRRGTYVESAGGNVELVPDNYFVRCVNLDEPEHMEPPQDSQESQQVEVFADPEVWLPINELTCEMRSSSVREYADPGQPDSERREESVDPVVRGDGEIGRWLRDDDQLVVTGYREAIGRRVEVVRSGATVGVVELSIGSDGWFIGHTDVCADVLS